MPKLNAPCYKCENRAKNCFSACEKYKAYKAELSERQVDRSKEKESDYLSYRRDKAIRYRKTDAYKNKKKGT